MATWIEFVILFLGLILVTLSGLFALMASTEAAKLPNFSSDRELQDARRLLIIAAVVASIGFLAVMGLFIYMMWEDTSSLVRMSLIILVILLVLVTGILAAIASSKIYHSPNYAAIVTENHAYRNSNVAAIVAIGGVAIILIFFVISLFVGGKEKTVVARSTTLVDGEPVTEEETIERRYYD